MSKPITAFTIEQLKEWMNSTQTIEFRSPKRGPMVPQAPHLFLGALEGRQGVSSIAQGYHFHTQHFVDTPIIESLWMTEKVEDWSKVRSPARARRRRFKHRQNIKVIEVPRKDFLKMPDGSIVCHPELVRKLSQAVAKQVDEKLLSLFNYR